MKAKPKYSEPITRDGANKIISNRINLVEKLKVTHGLSDDLKEFFTDDLNGFVFSKKRLDELFRQPCAAGKLDVIVAVLGAELDPKNPNGPMIPTIVLSACHSEENKGKSIYLVTPNTAHPATETPPKQPLAKLPDPS